MDERKLVLLHTNDLHSHFERMPRIAGAIRELRRAHAPSEPIVIDCGDHMDRMRPETEGSDGKVNIAVLNGTGYDLVVPGNNEGLTFTPSQLAAAYGERRGYSVVCANLTLQETGRPPDWMEPYRIVERDGVRVGVIGVTACFPDFYSLLGWNVGDPFEAAAKLVRRLRPEVHVLVVVSHLGLAHDKTMAETIDGIDVILGSHTHHLLEKPLVHERTIIAATGCYGRYVGELDLRYDMETGSLRLHDGGSRETESFPAHAGVEQTIALGERDSRERLQRVVATLEEPLDMRWDGESVLGNLLAAGLKLWTGAELGIVNAGQIVQGLEAGPVTRYRLLEICPSPINPCLIRLRGDELLQALEEALLDEFVGKTIRGFGFRGKVLGTLCLAGATVEYEADAKPYCKIRSVTVNGEPLDRERVYRLGTIDMFTFGIGYMSLARGETVRFHLPEFIRDVLERQLRDREQIAASHKRRWRPA